MKFTTYVRQSNAILNRIKKVKVHIENIISKQDLNQEDLEEINLYKEELQSKYAEFTKSVNQLISTEKVDEYDEDKLSELEDEISNVFISTQVLIKPYSTNNNTESSLDHVTSHYSANLKLPTLSLQTFDGSPHQWLSFRSLFQAAIHDNHQISEVERFQYLLSTVKGEPYNLIKNLPLTSGNYEVAWDILKKRYENSRKIVSLHLNNILDLQIMPDTSVKTIRVFVNDYQENTEALKALNHDITVDNVLLSAILLRKLHPDLCRKFECSRPNSLVVPSAEEIIYFIENECIHLEAADLSNSTLKSNVTTLHSRPKLASYTRPNYSNASNITKTVPRPNQKNSVLLASPNHNVNATCVYCRKVDHLVYQCPEFKMLTPQDRYAFTRTKNLCINCLRSSHVVKNCKSMHTCYQCKRKHHSLLHVTSNLDVEPNQAIDRQSSSDPPDQLALRPPLVAVSSTPTTTILLGTALVHLSTAIGNSVVVRAVIDSASMITCVTEHIACLLNLKRTSTGYDKVDGLSSTKVKTKGVAHVNVSSLNGTSVAGNQPVVILDKITSNLPHLSVPEDVKDKFKNLVLADPTFHKPSCVDMLIGADIFAKVLTGERIILSEHLPAAVNSVFGYIIIGSTPIHVPQDEKSGEPYNGIVTLLSTQDIDLHQSLQRFWALDEPAHKQHISQEEQMCEDHFCSSHSRLSDGRYVLRLPIKVNHPPLGDSSTCAKKRFFALEKQFFKRPDLKVKYTEAINDSLSAGHMEQVVTPPDSTVEHFYLPHHAVMKEESSTTKLRVVFDASARSTTGVSLNQILHTGPKLHNDLCDVLLQFRYFPIVWSCDIRQMFKMIHIHPEERKYQMLYWRENENQPLLTYRFTTVVFGLNCSPYLAIRTLHQLVADEGDKFPLAKQALLKQIYVDDLILGADNIQQSIELRDQVIQLLAKGGFELRKWTSNCTELIDDIPESHRETPRFQSEDSPHFNVLGMKWSPDSDDFFFQINLPSLTAPTKRSILATICKVFDPCGWISPISLWVKSLIQALWVINIQLDDKIPNELSDKWLKFVSQLPLLNEIRLPRYLCLADAQDIQLHGFCDGSESGYGAVIYLRTVNPNGNISTHLLIAKSRVSPIKRISIPRLELCGAHLLAKLLSHCQQLFSERYTINSVNAWCDSSVVLSWINTPSYRLKVYVANRVAEIQELVPSNAWSYVSTNLNPADVASRGSLPSSLVQNNLWWKGPQWLSSPSILWSVPVFTPTSDDVLPELKPEPLRLLITTDNTDLFSRFSSWSKLQRVMCYVLRFVNGCRRRHREIGNLKSAEMKEATNLICKVVQKQHFEDTSTRLQRLSPFVDPYGVQRVGGRLKHSNLQFSAKHPILLPKCHVANLIIDYYHCKYLHAGPSFIHATIAQTFWILSARSQIRQRIFKCITCFRCSPKTPTQVMGDLPSSRLIGPQRPFYNCGTDFTGAFMVKPHSLRRVSAVKVYLCIFICFLTKAVHLEVVTNLSAEAYIAALKRFVSRRGLCANIYSDCGTNFVGAASIIGKTVKSLFMNEETKRQLTSFASNNSINFHFQPPAAPHHGGLWERAVRSIKHHLTRVIGDQILTLEEFITLSTQVEAIMNSRPLTSISSDPSEIDCLTPGHFLIGGPLVAVPEEDLSSITMNRLSRWKLVQSLTQNIWKRWSQEYLNTLQQRQKWIKSSPNICVGELVLIKEPHTPLLSWPLGRVVKTFPGTDGLVRVVEIKTKSGLKTRPISKISPLPHE